MNLNDEFKHCRRKVTPFVEGNCNITQKLNQLGGKDKRLIECESDPPMDNGPPGLTPLQ